MKKKYFFGIFICLILLCSGVFLLATNNFNTVEKIIINDQADAIDVAITVTIGKVYGLGGQYISGATFNITVEREDKNGGNRKAGSTFNLSTYPASSHEGKVDASWLANYRYMTINSTTILSGGKYGDSTITTNYGWIESNRGSGGITGFRVRHDTADAYREGSFTLDIYWGIKYNCKYENGTDSSTDFYFSTKDNVVKTKPTIPTRTGYKFNGYYTAKSDGTQLIDANGNWTGEWNWSTARPAQLYAQWTPNTYQISYVLNGGKSSDEPPETATYGKTIEISNPTKTGYTFTGWRISNYSSTAETGTRFILLYTWSSYDGGLTTRVYFRNLQTTAGSTVTFTANWEINTYKVRFNANGGSGSMSDQTFTYGTAQKLTENTFTRAGHTFAGWKDGSGKSYGDEESVNNLTTTNGGTVTLYAQWQVNNLKANLNYMGGNQQSQPSSVSQQYSSSGTKLSLPSPSSPTSPTKTGYEFKGWSLTSNGTEGYDDKTDWNNITVDATNKKGSYRVSDANAGNIEFTLNAIWKANKYSVTLDQQGGRGGTTTITATYDSAMPTITVPSKFGYTFEGYYDSSGTKYYNANGTSARNWDKDSTATLNAKWTAYNYTLTLYGNDDITSDKQTTKTITGSYASNLTLPSKPFTRSGYIFKGWSTTKTGEVTYSDEANYSSLITSNDTKITLYAQWQSTIASTTTIKPTKPKQDNNGYFLISNIQELAWLSLEGDKAKITGNFKQTRNITIPNNIIFLPIGRLYSFSGTYDGQGNIISGITTYNGEDANNDYLETNGGLFVNASGAKIKNVIIENATIYGQNAGIVAGSGNTSTKISNCVVSGTVNGTNAGSIIGNGNGASISVCLAKGVNTASFAGGSANVDSCIYELADGTKGASDSFNNYSAWIYPSNFAYPMPKAFMWYPYPELTTTTLTNWINKK